MSIVVQCRTLLAIAGVTYHGLSGSVILSNHLVLPPFGGMLQGHVNFIGGSIKLTLTAVQGVPYELGIDATPPAKRPSSCMQACMRTLISMHAAAKCAVQDDSECIWCYRGLVHWAHGCQL